MNKEQIWNIILIISIILIIHGMTKTGSPDKKEAQAGTSETQIGAVGLGVSSIYKKQLWLGASAAVWKAIAIPLAMLIAFLPNIFTNFINAFKNVFSPQPTIPIWVYIAGFAVLVLFLSRKK